MLRPHRVVRAHGRAPTITVPEGLEARSRESAIGARIVPKPNGCWLWDGVGEEYGRVRVYGELVPAHRYVYSVLRRRSLTPDIVLHHRCLTPGCVNPMHLEETTHADHMRLHAELRKRAALRPHDSPGIPDE